LSPAIRQKRLGEYKVQGTTKKVQGARYKEKEWMRFEELDVWKRAMKLSTSIYKELKNLKDYGFKDQITRSGLSIPSNIAEGFERTSNKESVNFLSYAKGSCGELRTQIYIGIDIEYINKDKGQEWLQEVNEISAMLNGLIKTRRKFT
jgi:four helix bundle protein